MQFFDSDEPLEAEDYEFIEGMFRKHGSDQSMISASELDGFLTAIVSGPRMIMPSEWMSHIWGGEEHAPAWDRNRQAPG